MNQLTKDNGDTVHLLNNRVYPKGLLQKVLDDCDVENIPYYKLAKEVLSILESSEHLDFNEDLYDDTKFLKYKMRMGGDLEGQLKDLLTTLTENNDVISLSEHIPLVVAKLKSELKLP